MQKEFGRNRDYYDNSAVFESEIARKRGFVARGNICAESRFSIDLPQVRDQIAEKLVKSIWINI